MENNNWISVEDNLPPYDEEVFVYGLPYLSSPQMGGNKPTKRITQRKDLRHVRGMEQTLRALDKNDFMYMEEVTHWQPLPADPI